MQHHLPGGARIQPLGLGRFDQRFHQQEEVGRAGARHRGDRIQLFLFVEPESNTHGTQDLPGHGFLCIAHVIGGIQASGTGLNQRRRIGHAAHNRGATQPVAQVAHGHTGSDGDHQRLTLSDQIAQVGADLLHHLRLHRQHQYVNAPGHITIFGAHVHPVELGHLVQAVFGGIAHPDTGRANSFRHHATGQAGCHVAGADKSD